MSCSFKVVRGPRGPLHKIVDRRVLHRNKIARKNKHATILLYSILLRIKQKILAGRLTVKVLQTFEVVRGPRGPRISILGLNIVVRVTPPTFREMLPPPRWIFRQVVLQSTYYTHNIKICEHRFQEHHILCTTPAVWPVWTEGPYCDPLVSYERHLAHHFSILINPVIFYLFFSSGCLKVSKKNLNDLVIHGVYQIM